MNKEIFLDDNAKGIIENEELSRIEYLEDLDFYKGLYKNTDRYPTDWY